MGSPDAGQQVEQSRGLALKRAALGSVGQPRDALCHIDECQLLHPRDVNVAVGAGAGKNQFQHLAGLGAALALREAVEANGLRKVGRLPLASVVSLCLG